MRSRIDITNQKFGKLTALEPASSDYPRKGHWKCLCDCGNIHYVCGSRLRKGVTKSCGCFRKEFGRQIGKSNLVKIKKVDWSNPSWSYILGVLHGDGHVLHTKENIPTGLDFSVGYKDREYANLLSKLFLQKGFRPKLTEGKNGLSLRIHSRELGKECIMYKNKEDWNLPNNISTPDYIAGLVDTDGSINKSVYIAQKSNGNLDKVIPLLKKLKIEAHKYTFTIQYKDQPYYVDNLTICKHSEISKFNNIIPLRHYRKIKMLEKRMEYINNLKVAQ